MMVSPALAPAAVALQLALLGAAAAASHAGASARAEGQQLQIPDCAYDGRVRWDGPRSFLAMLVSSSTRILG